MKVGVAGAGSGVVVLEVSLVCPIVKYVYNYDNILYGLLYN